MSEIGFEPIKAMIDGVQCPVDTRYINEVVGMAACVK